MRVVDLHCDTLYKHVTEGVPLDAPDNEVLLPVGKDDRKLQCYAIWLPDTMTGAQAEALVLRAAESLRSECARLDIRLLNRGDDARALFFQNRNTAFLTIENGLALNGKAENVSVFSALGVRMMTLTWNAHNPVGDGADVTDAKGLTRFGQTVLREMEREHMIADISHASEKLFADVAEQVALPFVASHSNAFAVTPHRRNLRDWQIREIIRRGGLFGLNFHNAFLNSEPEAASVTDLLRHADHFLSLGGESCLCFGSDFDGGDLPRDIADSRVYNKIYELFLQHHYPEALIRRIFYDNALNFFENFDNQRIML